MIPAIPLLDPMPVPAPIWLVKALLWVTFSVHLLFMNVTLGGAVLSAVYAVKGKDRDRALARTLAKLLPFVMPFAITFGVAPLLFVQVLYGPLFYTSTILMAAPFLAIIGVLIAAYYGMYLLAWKWTALGRAQGWLAAAIFMLLAYVGFTYTHVFTLMTSPDRFRAMYLAHPGGVQYFFGDPMLLPRFLHMFLGYLAVTGLMVAYLGTKRLRLEPELGRWQFKAGITWFAAATVANLGVGAWWLMALPREAMLLFMGGSALATGAFIAGLVFGVSALVLALMGINSLKPLPMLMGAGHALAVTLICMVLMRDALRDALLKPAYDVWTLPSDPQWVAVGLFLVLFAGGLGVCVWLLKLMSDAARANAAKGDDGNRGPGLTDSGLHRISAEDSQAMRGGLAPESGQRPRVDV